ncbi:hypothetical protein ILUMI_22691 [Ignelater luminosus]|uniref:Cytochrome c oxidase subunit 4 n=1 Tax=Ignelater luminosus TaxID=2038154 RepID=A0A8K0G0A8_IGNLU|nr:hypothetical protein ILUMI_22691 [Ignelater luminosus]
MITSRLILLNLKSKSILPLSQLNIIRPPKAPPLIQRRTVIGFADKHTFKDEDEWIRKRIGNREIVGYGTNGEPEYVDRVDYPFPSLRWKPPYPEIQALREKEKGDWRLLSIEEKKALYRANFRQTFAEFLAPTGDWMGIVGVALILTSIGIWLYMLLKKYVYVQTPMPKSLSFNSQQAQCARMLQLRTNPCTGLASKWDYEKMKWKSKPWYIPWEDPYAPIIECEEDLD